ncbi:hypothetical protein [Pseudobacteriovorax antillogorgiicola]|uniref:Uncharacterized protein n=1 Tax=Pseudobacteriovorax antillogorgiicola TaxID=1513793 RepID=A0A1Y6CWR3_9BACT|nr:hypothetical protein [Pseudobacteriovorax antillogorgiicola]TCS42754.1 hypothetical protein EDD56_14022 [Pseudobacteriovorax antillogorgiicola]SMF82265.1 hypothetical protein SAMN06296036_14022 [Pseudobacteriovorax antillogorgiicola]
MKLLSWLALGFAALSLSPAQAQIDTEERYLLKTLFRGDGECLEGNRFASSSTLGGAAFMSECRPFSGQIFRFEESGLDGYYLLKTEFLGDDFCLEGNEFAPSSTLKGAAFMAPCDRPATGQLWRIESHSSGYKLLKTLFQGNDKCLEGNRFASSSTLGGAAFMASCQRPATGQLWRFEVY